MRTGIIVAAVAVVALVGGASYYMVDIEQTQEAALPDVEISDGQLPAYDADVGSVSVGSTETTVSVPEVEITTDERTVEVPTLEVTPPDANEG